MTLRPFFSFYGGKWRTAKRYPVPKFSTIIEPFAGSAGYSLRYPSHKVILYERDPIIAAVWQFLIGASPAEILAIPDITPGMSIDDLALCQEAKWLVGFWLNRAAAAPCKTPSKWMREPAYANSFWGPRVKNTIARQLPAIRHWKIVPESYEKAPDIQATWFVDPPYEGAGRYYRFGSSTINYEALGVWCKTRSGQVIVCENEGASWLPFAPFLNAKTTRRARRSMEAIWTKGEAA